MKTKLATLIAAFSIFAACLTLALLSPRPSAGIPPSSSPGVKKLQIANSAIGFASMATIESPYDLGKVNAQRYTGFEIHGNLYTVRMPCGEVLTVGPGTLIPTKDVPCPCGDTSHFLWKIRS